MARQMPKERRKVYSSMEAAAADRATEKFHSDAAKRQRGTFTATETGARQTANLREQARLRAGIQTIDAEKKAKIKHNRDRANRKQPGFTTRYMT